MSKIVEQYLEEAKDFSFNSQYDAIGLNFDFDKLKEHIIKIEQDYYKKHNDESITVNYLKKEIARTIDLNKFLIIEKIEED